MKRLTTIIGLLAVALVIPTPSLKAQTSVKSPVITVAEPPVDSKPTTALREQPAKSPLATKPRLTPWATQMVKLAQSGIEEGIMIAFVDSAGVFGLGADQIIYLNEIGVSSQVIAVMLEHDREILSGERALTVTSQVDSEPLVFSAVHEISAKPEPAPNTLAAPPDATAQPAPQSQPNTTSTTSATQAAPAVPRTEAVLRSSTVFSPPQPSAPKTKRPLYPTRKPYAVELLPPIIIVTAPDSTPDTVILSGFAAH